MQKLIILGTSSALSSLERANTHMVVMGSDRMVLIDVPGASPSVRLQQIGLDSASLTDIFVTHFHPDHTLGIPSLIMDCWIMGRKKPLNIHGLPSVLQRVKAMLDLYDWSDWQGLFPVHFLPIPEKEQNHALQCHNFSITSSPVRHTIPTIGLRIDFLPSHHSVAYSCDTTACDEVVRLSINAAILIHDSGGDSYGHSSAFQAGQIASQAKVKRLYLIHYSADQLRNENLVGEARRTFSGEVILAEDFLTLDFEDENFAELF